MRYAVLSDVHANLPALLAVLNDLAAQSVTTAIYLGDAVGYYADSAAAIALLRETVGLQPRGERAGDPLWVAGNHEWGLLGRIEAYHFSQSALVALERTRAELPASTLAFLAALPARVELDLGDGLAATLVHASPIDPVGATGAGYIENGEDARDAAQAFETQICLVGHTHYPRICHETGARWEAIESFEDVLPGQRYAFGRQRVVLNPGSVGQPRDGDPRASYAILDTSARTFAIRRVPYEIQATQSRVRAWLADQPAALLDGHGGLAERLRHGV